MGQRYEVRKGELLAGCGVKPELFEGVRERLKEFVRPFADKLRRTEQKEYALSYVEGLLSDLDSKNAESIAYLHGLGRKTMQHFIGESPWDPAPLIDELVAQVGAAIGEPDGVIVIDPSAHEKKGDESVGVKRQWNGRLGKVDNCQVGIYLGYASRKEHALVDERLFLPQEWAEDPGRRRKCGVPEEVRFRTRHELALRMLRKHRRRLPHAWVAGDDEMGRPGWFRASLRGMREQYLLGAPANTSVRDLEGRASRRRGRGRRPKRPLEQMQAWVAHRPAGAWAEVEVRQGEKGPIVVECLKRRVQAHTEDGRIGPEELLFVSRERTGQIVKHNYCLSNAPADTSLAELARAAKAEHRIEECLQRAKGEAGLSDYEVRTWAGWHHHQALALMAVWFLTRHTSWGKKADAGDHGPAGQDGDRVAAA